MNEGNRVYVDGGGMQGMATVMCYFPKEIYGVQVELDHADENGQRVHRFATNEVNAAEQTRLQDLDGKYYAKVIKKYSWFTVGDEYIVGPTAEKQYFNVYALNGFILGAYSENFLEAIRPIEEPQIAHVVKTQEMPVFEVLVSEGVFIHTQPKNEQDEPRGHEITRNKTERVQPAEQMNIFDFI